MTSPADPAFFLQHSTYSSPGDHAVLLAEAPSDPRELSALVRNVIVHYRAEAQGLPEASNDDIHERTVAGMLALDQERHPRPLRAERERTQRVQGCCRDHTLLAVGALRERGVPARSVIGFAGYLSPDWHYDHVVVDHWNGERWVRFDPEIVDPLPLLATPQDIPTGLGSPFETAAQLWAAYRRQAADLTSYGVAPGLPELAGPSLVHNYVFLQLAHRQRDEVLLWDNWGVMVPPGGTPQSPELADQVAELLNSADVGDAAADEELTRLYRHDDRLRPGPTVLRGDPRGGPPIEDQLPG